MTRSLRLTPTLLSIFAGFLLATSSAQAQDTVEIIVKRDSGLTRAERADIRSDAGVAFKRASTIDNVELVTVPRSEAPEALSTLNRDGDVEFAELNGRVRAQSMPPFRVPVNDPYLSEQYSIYNYGQPVSGGTYSTTAGSDMRVRYAWNLVDGTAHSTDVAVIDTGVAMNHPDLKDNLWTNNGEIAGNGIDDDANGYIDDVKGWDFAGADNDANHEDNGHGTHVAGIIGARRNNGIGVAGVFAPGSHIAPLRVLGSDGSGSWLSVAEGLDYAGMMGFEVANASLGGYGSLSLIDEVITDHPDTLYVFAAGNDGRNLDSYTFYPCESPEANVMCVAATDLNDNRASWSNYSGTGTAVDVAAPGLNIFSTYMSTNYAWMAGTSMASPNAAGVAALIASSGTNKTGAQLKALIMSTARLSAEMSTIAAAGVPDALTAVRTIVTDTDNDGLANSSDSCPTSYSSSSNGCPDTDGDGVTDNTDNCPSNSNSSQTDSDGDGIGDACDVTPNGPDADNDGVLNEVDNCPNAANSSQTDTDGDGTGDACDVTPNGPDADLDGVLDASDNCPSTTNAGQTDADGDGTGDACDSTPRGADGDGDGVAALDDKCPTQAGPSSNNGCPLATPSPTPAPAPAPAPAPTPQPPANDAPTIEKLAAKVKARKLTITVQVDEASKVLVQVEKKTCTKAKCSLKVVKQFSKSVVAGKTTPIAAGKLAKGSYQLTVTASDGTLLDTETKSFSVR